MVSATSIKCKRNILGPDVTKDCFEEPKFVNDVDMVLIHLMNNNPFYDVDMDLVRLKNGSPFLLLSIIIFTYHFFVCGMIHF